MKNFKACFGIVCMTQMKTANYTTKLNIKFKSKKQICRFSKLLWNNLCTHENLHFFVANAFFGGQTIQINKLHQKLLKFLIWAY